MNLKIAATFLFFGHLTFSSINAQGNNDRCTTPNNEQGECIPVDQCPRLMVILSKRNPLDLDYVRRSNCGYNRRIPIVCCPYSNDGNKFTQVSTSSRPSTSTTRAPSPKNKEKNTSSYDTALRDNSLLTTQCGGDLSSRIIGGNFTELDEFPWMALLEYRHSMGLSLACGGSLINNRYILTAAHCLRGPSISSSWELEAVRLGEHNTVTDPDCIPYGDDDVVCAPKFLRILVEERIVHEKYVPNSRHQLNDIALLRLAETVEFSNYVKPICLPNDGRLSRKLQVSGWGKTEGRSESEVKLKVALPLSDIETCANTYQNVKISLGHGQFCAGGEKDQDSCTGDSGGPLMQMDRMSDGNRKWSVVGIVSFGPRRCGTQDWPGVYTKVHDFIPWILRNMRA